MAKRRGLLVGLLVVVLLLIVIAGGAAWYLQPKKVVVTLEVNPHLQGGRGNDPDAVPIKGTYDVDGKTGELTGQMGSKFTLEPGKRVIFTLYSPAENASFSARYSIDGQSKGFSGTAAGKNGVRGWVKTHWGGKEPDHWIENYNSGAQDPWLSAPPP
jgi:hypothetical protein